VKAASQRNLHQYFEDFKELVPTDEVKKIVSNYVDTNTDVQAALKFLHSDDFKFQYKKINEPTVVKGVVDYLNDAEVQIVEFLNKFADLLDLEQNINTKTSS
jgi:predicted ATP-binding protein involved in virulence